MAGQLTIDTLKASSGVLATQNGMTGICKAWVNFNGTNAAIRGAFNVSSITKNGTGDFSMNLTTALNDANYSATSMSDLGRISKFSIASTASLVRVQCCNDGAGTFYDPNYMLVTVNGA